MAIIQNPPPWTEIGITGIDHAGAGGGNTYYDPNQYLRDQLAKAYEKLKELQEVTRGLTDARFNDVPNGALILELIARGFAVYKPLNEGDAD